MKVSAIIKVLREGNKEAIKAVIENRKAVNQSKLRFLMSVVDHGCTITEDNMGSATWYYIKNANGTLLGSQFYWNEGQYNAQGEHSLYNEYGQAL